MRKGWIGGVNSIPTLHRYIWTVLHHSKGVGTSKCHIFQAGRDRGVGEFSFYFMIRTSCLVAGSVILKPYNSYFCPKDTPRGGAIIVSVPRFLLP